MYEIMAVTMLSMTYLVGLILLAAWIAVKIFNK